MFRPIGLFAACLLLSACAQGFDNGPPPVTTLVAPAPTQPAGPRRIALLLPLSGPNQAVAQAMQLAAELAAAAPNAIPLDVRDTGGDPQRAAQAAQAAIAAGDLMILGPLTAEETQAVASITMPAGIAVLAFTSDPAVAQPGVWTLGVTPGQQMRRLVAAAHDEGRKRIAALLPYGAFGDAMQTALTDAANLSGFESPSIRRGGDTAAGAADALKTLSNFDGRRGELDARIRAMRDSTDPASRQQAAVLAAQPTTPPPFDTLVLAANGNTLRQIADLLPGDDISAPQVRLLGPSFWATQAAHLGRLAGGWYAVPDTSQRASFVTAYQGKYGAVPPPLADIAFDAALIGQSAGASGNIAEALANPEGFSGVDGALTLQSDGHVRRALAIYQIRAEGGARLVSPAPSDLSSPGS